MTVPATPPPSAAHREPRAPSSESELSRRFLVGAVAVLGATASSPRWPAVMNLADSF